MASEVEHLVRVTYYCDVLSGNGIGTETFESDSEEDCRSQAEAAGWHSVRFDGAVLHFCPHCARGFFEELWVPNWDGVLVKAGMLHLRQYPVLPDAALVQAALAGDYGKYGGK